MSALSLQGGTYKESKRSGSGSGSGSSMHRLQQVRQQVAAQAAAASSIRQQAAGAVQDRGVRQVPIE